MRYIKQKIVTTTVIDTTISKTEDLLELLKKMQSDSAEFILILKKNKSGLALSEINTYNKVKIISINNNQTVDFIVFTRNTSTKLRNIKISEIDTIHSVYNGGISQAGTIETLKKNIVEILEIETETSRFGMMDLDLSNDGD